MVLPGARDTGLLRAWRNFGIWLGLFVHSCWADWGKSAVALQMFGMLYIPWFMISNIRNTYIYLRSIFGAFEIWETAIFLAGLIYILSPLDVVPDLLGPIGMIDDIFIGVLVPRLLWKSLQFAYRCYTAYVSPPILLTYTGSGVCPVCLDLACECTLNPCGHRFCNGDAQEFLRRRMRCPMCRSQIRRIEED